MKLHVGIFLVLTAVLISACNMTLAQDVTPPPGAVQRAQPTPGPVFPAQAPDLQKGAALYVEKCAPCHGETGMGDGPQGKQLPVPVAALGLPEVAAQASPADWFHVVTTGNIENFMPPFASLSDQERWDVVAYAFSLSAASEQIGHGKQLFEENCADCPTDRFTDQETMAALSTVELANLLAVGGEGLPALGESLSREELQSIAVYLRTLTFGAPSLASGPASTAATTSPNQSEVPATDQAEESTVPIGFDSVSGKLVNGSNGDVPAGATVTLHVFEHSTDPNTMPQEVLTKTTDTDSNGTFTFDEVSMPEGRIFLVEANYQGINFQSELVVSEPGAPKLTIPDIIVYESTTDSDGLVVEQLHVSFDMAQEGGVQVFELFTISNTSDEAYVFATDGTSLPFMPLPEGARNVGLELSQDSALLLPTDSGEFAIAPSDKPYSIIAFFNMPYDNSLELQQPLALPVSSALVIVPEGIKVKSDQLTDAGIRQTQQGFNVQTYTASGLNAGTPLEIALSGSVKSAASVDNRQTLLIGAGAFGMVLILAGVWMFFRDRGKPEDDDFEDEEGNEDELETAEEVMDAIIALDDLHRAKKIPDEAYQKRREELKERLKELA
jgi:mono/diheme cytochrome c family protein